MFVPLTSAELLFSYVCSVQSGLCPWLCVCKLFLALLTLSRGWVVVVCHYVPGWVLAPLTNLSSAPPSLHNKPLKAAWVVCCCPLTCHWQLALLDSHLSRHKHHTSINKWRCIGSMTYICVCIRVYVCVWCSFPWAWMWLVFPRLKVHSDIRLRFSSLTNKGVVYDLRGRTASVSPCCELRMWHCRLQSDTLLGGGCTLSSCISLNRIDSSMLSSSAHGALRHSCHNPRTCRFTSSAQSCFRLESSAGYWFTAT